MDNLDSKISARVERDLPTSFFLITSDGRTLRLPIASRSSKDPLNWSKVKRAAAYTTLFMHSITLWVLLQIPFFTLPAIVARFGRRNVGPLPFDSAPTVHVLCVGLGAFFWGPLTLALGRRSSMLSSIPILILGLLWASLANTYVQLVAAIGLSGFAEGSYIVLALLALIDLTFIHQRPFMIGAIYASTGLIVVGFITLLPLLPAVRTDLRATFIMCEIPVSITATLLLFLVPETYFQRPPVAFDGRVLIQTSTEKIEIYDDWEAAQAEKELPDLPSSKFRNLVQLLSFWKFNGGSWHACFYCYFQIIYCFIQPLLFWVLLLRCLTSAGLNLIAGTYTQIAIDGTKFMTMSQITLFQVSGIIGILLSWPASSLLNTNVVHKLSMRNKGVRKAQFYLPALLMPALSMTAALLFFALAARYQLNFMLYCISYFLVCFSYTALEAAATTWVIEAFPQNVVAALTVTSGSLFTVAFALGFATLPWVESQGIFGACVQLASAIFATGVVGTSLTFWGASVSQKLRGRWATSEEGALRPQSTHTTV